MTVVTVVPHAVLEMGEDGLIESGRVPGGIFGCHKQRVSPIGDAFSFFVSGRQLWDSTPPAPQRTASWTSVSQAVTPLNLPAPTSTA
ncbi:hypothetical protein GCM10008960_37080 [Deinococcus sedimenti]|uniref:Uncharacterized protein n=1 Tax=Deinococcus sedimenti TaxID=1867090 RepID=A0ABQ2S9B4_9DEIO|nr:hypothetical protein GCM10008960_37080 [Deinococcus sedimenti]